MAPTIRKPRAVREGECEFSELGKRLRACLVPVAYLNPSHMLSLREPQLFSGGRALMRLALQLLLLRECILNIGESFRVANLTSSVGSSSIGLFLSFLLACLRYELFNSRWLVVFLLFFELVLGQLKGE